MNRTPRSASRRARRQFDANDPSPGFAPYSSRMCGGSALMSRSPGTLVCILNAISYWAMRVCSSGSCSDRFAHLVQRVDGLNRVLLHVAADAGRIGDVQNRIADGIEAHSLEFARQHAGRPLPRGDRLHLTAVPLRHENDETGEVVGFCAQAIQHPRSHARPARDDRSAVHEGVGGVVVDLLGPHRSHDARLVDDAADVRKQLADDLPRFAERLEAVRRSQAGQPLSLELRDLLSSRERLGHCFARHARELRLVVECLEM